MDIIDVFCELAHTQERIDRAQKRRTEKREEEDKGLKKEDEDRKLKQEEEQRKITAQLADKIRLEVKRQELLKSEKEKKQLAEKQDSETTAIDEMKSNRVDMIA